jgi:hypothetical protein
MGKYFFCLLVEGSYRWRGIAWYYTAALGIHGPSLASNSAHALLSRLTALMWIGQLLFLKYTIPVYIHNTLELA